MGIILRQGLLNSVISYLGILIAAVNLVIIQPHFLSPEEIGLTRILYNFSTLVSVFIPLGVTNIAIRYFPQYRDPEQRHHGFLGFILLFPLAGALLSSSLLFLFRDFFVDQYTKESPLFASFFEYVIPFSFILGLINVLNVYCFALFKTTVPSLLNDVLVRIFYIILISIYFLKLISLEQFLLLFIVIYGMQLLFLVIYIIIVDKPGILFKAEVVGKDIRKIVSYGLILSVASFAAIGIKYLDTIMIGKYLPLAFAGIYSVAAFIPTVIESPFNALDRIAGSKLSNAMATNNMSEIREIYYRSSKYLLLLGGFLFALIVSNASPGMLLLPEEYRGGEVIIYIISFASLINMAAGTNMSLIFSSERYKFGAILLVTVAVVAFLSNVILIPAMGLAGAAIATTIAAFCYSFSRYFFIYRVYSLQPFNKISLLIVTVTAIAVIAGLLLPDFSHPIITIGCKSIAVVIIFSVAVLKFRLLPQLVSNIPFLRRIG